jgi:fluoride exporter
MVVESTFNHCLQQSMTPTFARGKVGVFFLPPLPTDDGLAWRSVLSKYLAVAVGGALGALARYWVASVIGSRFDSRFPFSTLAINLSGSFIAGLFLALILERVNMHPNWRLAVVVGFLGAYTTFSTFAYESFKLLEERAVIRGFANLIASMTLGLIAVWLGVVAARGIDRLIEVLHGPPPHVRMEESFTEMAAIAGLAEDEEISKSNYESQQNTDPSLSGKGIA